MFALVLAGVVGATDNPIFATPADHGFPSAAELSRRYADATGLDLADLGTLWYAAFACFKFAVICEGIHYRHVHGLTVGEGFDRIGALVPEIVRRGLAALAPEPGPDTGRTDGLRFRRSAPSSCAPSCWRSWTSTSTPPSRSSSAAIPAGRSRGSARRSWPSCGPRPAGAGCGTCSCRA